jgi:GT2 family glycosyltransferase
VSHFVVVLHYGSVEDTRRCLDSLDAVRTSGLEVLVVDNSGDPATAGAIARNTVRVIEAGENKGFAAGNNDTVVAPDFLDRLLAFLETAPPDAGALTPLILNGAPGQSPRESVWFWRGRLRWRVGRAVHEGYGAPPPEETEPVPTETVTGCCCLMTREALEKTGLLDESYFLYWEDTDWVARARKAGFTLWSVPEARIHHIGSSSTGLESELYCYYYHRNQLRFLRRHAPWGAWPFLAPSLAFDYLRKMAAWALRHGKAGRTRIRGTLWGVFDFVRGRQGPWTRGRSS